MSYKILVIDDDETILRLIKNILQLNDYDVTIIRYYDATRWHSDL